jgi:hypothetical protein
MIGFSGQPVPPHPPGMLFRASRDPSSLATPDIPDIARRMPCDRPVTGQQWLRGIGDPSGRRCMGQLILSFIAAIDRNSYGVRVLEYAPFVFLKGRNSL